MKLRDFECIIAVAEEKSISKAAAKIYVTQPSLSQTLAKIENRVGAPLFVRTPGGLVITEAGDAFVKAGRRILKTYSDLESELYDLNNMKRGHLSFGITNYLGSYYLPSILTAYNKLYPNIDVQLVEQTSLQLEKDLTQNLLDIAFLHGPVAMSNIRCECLADERLLLAIPEGHPILAQSYCKPGELIPFIDFQLVNGQSIIMSKPSRRMRQLFSAMLEKAGVTPKSIVASDSIETCARLCGANMGITLLPESYIKQFHFSPQPIYRALEPEYNAQWQLVIAYNSEATLSRPAQEMCKVIHSYFRHGQPEQPQTN